MRQEVQETITRYLTRCDECGREMRDHASTCRFCGRDICRHCLVIDPNDELDDYPDQFCNPCWEEGEDARKRIDAARQTFEGIKEAIWSEWMSKATAAAAEREAPKTV